MSGGQPGAPGMGMPGDMGGAGSMDVLSQLGQLGAAGTSRSSGSSQGQTPKPPPPPRPVGTITEELGMIGSDFGKGVVDLLNFAKWFGIESAQLSPEEKAKLKQVHTKFTQLTEQQQMVAREKMQKEQQRKQRIAQEDAQKRQADADGKQSYVVPSGKQSGAQNAGGNKKQRAVQTLQDKRKTLSGPSSAN